MPVLSRTMQITTQTSWRPSWLFLKMKTTLKGTSLLDAFGHLALKRKNHERALHVCTLGVTDGNWRGLPIRNFLCMCKNGGVTSHPKDFAHTALVLEKKNKVRYFLNAPRISMSWRALSLCSFRKRLYSFIISDVIIRITVFILVSYCPQENTLWAYM